MTSLLTFTEAAKYAGVHVKTIQKHVKHGRLEFTQTPMGKRIPRHCLEPYRQLQEPEGVDRSPGELHLGTREDTEGSEKIPTGSPREPDGVAETYPRPVEGVQGSPEESTTRSSKESKRVDEALSGTVGSQMDTAGVVPLVAHLAALNTAQKALERAEKAERLWESQLERSEEYRAKAELAERQRQALEFQLSQYRSALSDQAESLAEARAEKQVAQLQVEEIQQSSLRIDTRKPSFGQRVKGWFGLRKAQ